MACINATGAAGSTAVVTITYPSALPAGTVYWKYGRTASNPTAHWYRFAGAVISGRIITLSITDNADGDDAYTTPGVIADPGGPGVPDDSSTTGIPTLSEWGMVIVSGLLALVGFHQARRRNDKSTTRHPASTSLCSFIRGQVSTQPLAHLGAQGLQAAERPYHDFKVHDKSS